MELHAFTLELGRALANTGTTVSETQVSPNGCRSGEPRALARVLVLSTGLMLAGQTAGLSPTGLR